MSRAPRRRCWTCAAGARAFRPGSRPCTTRPCPSAAAGGTACSGRTGVGDVLGVSKVFPPRVKALPDASLRIPRGEVHCLLGANGAGKSTLMKIIAGAHPPNAGEIRIDGNVVQFRSPQDARRAGIAMIYQELDLVPQLTVEENLLLGHVPAGL